MVSYISRAWALLLLVGALALGGATAHADKPSANEVKQAKREYDLGYQDLQARRFGDALAHYQRSYELVARPRTLYNMALCEQELGQEETAYRRYQAFLAVAEARDADIVADAKTRLAALDAKLVGRVIVESTPAGATVRVDGNRAVRGKTPVTIDLAPGEHTVQIAAPGASPIERTVMVEPRANLKLSVALEYTSQIILRVEPDDATIERDGDGQVATGVFVARVPPGKYTFRVQRAGYESETLKVSVVDSQIYEQRVRMVPTITSANLFVRSPGANVLIDGAPPASSPLPDGGVVLPPGEHSLSVSRAGHLTWEQTLHLSPGETVAVDVALGAKKGSPWLRWGGFSIGAVSVVGGGVLGVMALRDVTSDEASRHDSGKSRALIADGLFVLGVATIATVWRLTRASSTKADIRRTSEEP